MLRASSSRGHCLFLVPVVLLGAVFQDSMLRAQEECVEIARRIPPLGIEIPQEKKEVWQQEMETLRIAITKLSDDVRPDVEVLLKACEFAIDHRELRNLKDFALVDRLLGLAKERIGELSREDRVVAWRRMAGRQVRGFRSRIDGSVQPVGFVFPESLPQDKQVPLYVWLHGRGDSKTDIHFLVERLDRDGQIKPDGAIVVHPFGRHCVGYKSAGEVDVLEAIEFACQQYPVDRERIVLMGFSMGGAGVWHVAAHYADRFVAASPGAGFAETARYRRLKPEDYPAKYVQLLWGVYDVPGYTRNLFNLPVVAYSGEKDKQIQAVRVMEEAFAKEGRELAHLIGPGMGHKYHPDTLAEILRRMATTVEQSSGRSSDLLQIQAKHLRYGGMHGMRISGVSKQYDDSRITAQAAAANPSHWELEVSDNVTEISFTSNDRYTYQQIRIGNQTLNVPGTQKEWTVHRATDNSWVTGRRDGALWKRPGLSGPIDDAFLDPFLLVTPTGKSTHAKVDQWVQCELSYLRDRWKTLFRGRIREKRDVDVTAEDHQNYHLVLFGTPESNSVLQAMLASKEQRVGKLPIRWSAAGVGVGKTEFDASSHIPLMIYPNPNSPERYVVLNSGPTFRPAHDVTNSLQNPHLPDWAVISLDEPRSNELPGRVAKTGFFNAKWQIDPSRTW